MKIGTWLVSLAAEDCRGILCCLMSLVALAGCSDLPETGFPLLPTPKANVVSEQAGRGSYDWQFENGKLLVYRPFESKIFEQIDHELVRNRVAQVFANPAIPDYQPPSWLDDELRFAIEACLHPTDAAPSRSDTLDSEPLSVSAAQKVRLALNDDGSRLLVVSDKLSLWETQTGRLLKEVACPTADAKFVYLTPDCNRAFVFDTQAGYRITLDDTASDGSDGSDGSDESDVRTPAMAAELGEVAASTACDLFFVQVGSEVVRFNGDLQLGKPPVLSLSRAGSMVVMPRADRLAAIDGGHYTIIDYQGDGIPLVGKVRSEAKPRAVVFTPLMNPYAVFDHEIIRVVDPTTIPFRGNPILNTIEPVCLTRLMIDRAFTVSNQVEKEAWITVCAESKDAATGATQYQMFDIDMMGRTNSLPTRFGGGSPAQLALSGNAQVVAMARADEPIKIIWRGPRLIKHSEFDGLVARIANLFITQRFDQAEELIGSLEKYAESAPYTLATRPFLYVRSAVAKQLARPSKQSVQVLEFEPAAELKDWLKSDAMMAKLVRATNLASRRYGTGKEIALWANNNQNVQNLVEEILTQEHPPQLAYEILANLTAISKQDNQTLNKAYTTLFQRDPLSPELHMCMASFFAPEKAGDVGQSAAYLDRLCEYLPDAQREAFYSVYGMKIVQALLPENTRYIRNEVPVIYELIDGPYSLSQTLFTEVSVLTSRPYGTQSMASWDQGRLKRGLEQLIKNPSPIWENQLTPDMLVVSMSNSTDVTMETRESIAERRLQTHPFLFPALFARDPKLLQALREKFLQPGQPE